MKPTLRDLGTGREWLIEAAGMVACTLIIIAFLILCFI